MNFPKVIKIASVLKRRLNASTENALIKLRPIDIINNKLFEILESRFGFSYEIVSPSDSEFGTLLPDGNWTGMVGMIHRGDADIIIGDLSVTESRSKVIDFSQPYFVDRESFATKFLKNSHNDTFLINAFAFEVWIAIIIRFLLSR